MGILMQIRWGITLVGGFILKEKTQNIYQKSGKLMDINILRYNEMFEVSFLMHLLFNEIF